MDVGSVSSSLYTTIAASSQAQVRARQSEQEQQAQQSQSTQQAQTAQQAQARPSVDEAESAARSRADAEKNRPTVNTSGQIVGTRVNTTA